MKNLGSVFLRMVKREPSTLKKFSPITYWQWNFQFQAFRAYVLVVLSCLGKVIEVTVLHEVIENNYLSELNLFFFCQVTCLLVIKLTTWREQRIGAGQEKIPV